MPRKASPLPSSSDSEPAPILPNTSNESRASFELVPVAPRQDGWTPQRQREFIEALADSGCVKTAAQAVGMTTTSAYRLRRRADARAFDAAWEAALERAMQLLLPAAIDRALNGVVRTRYYHGEIVAEERIYSDRLLLRLLDKGAGMLAHARARRAIGENWDGAMADIEAGDPAPPEPSDPPAPSGGHDDEDAREEEPAVNYLYEQYPADGRWITNAPPPPDFDPSLMLTERHFENWRYCVDEELAAIAWFEAEEAAEEEADRRRFFELDENGRFVPPCEGPAATGGRGAGAG
ncbi:MAG TPA: hypothetical protein VGE65_07555 [Sphingobium sp.]